MRKKSVKKVPVYYGNLSTDVLGKGGNPRCYEAMVRWGGEEEWMSVGKRWIDNLPSRFASCILWELQGHESIESLFSLSFLFFSRCDFSTNDPSWSISYF